MTRRDKINHIITAKLTATKDSAIGHAEFTQLVAETTDEIMELSRPKEEIIHVIGPNGNHRLIVDGKSSEWKSQTEIAKEGNYVATTDFYMGQLPQLGRVTVIDSNQFMTTAQQNLNMQEIRYIRKDLFAKEEDRL